ncbi:helix-turn-helix domain-containing protein [Methylobacterium oryzae CBMB20]
MAASPSLAAAARSLNVSPPAVTQRLRGLETRLRVHLVDRSGRGLTLTDEGNCWPSAAATSSAPSMISTTRWPSASAR